MWKTVIAVIAAVLINGCIIAVISHFLLIYVKVKKLRDCKCVFTGEYLKMTGVNDKSYKMPDREVYTAELRGSTLYVDAQKKILKGETVQGDCNYALVSPSLGYKIIRYENSFYANPTPAWARDSEVEGSVKKTNIRFEIASFGKLDEKKIKTLKRVVKSANYVI